jgi:hypothetical protein
VGAPRFLRAIPNRASCRAEFDEGPHPSPFPCARPAPPRPNGETLLTFLTDGGVEARTVAGELFGFERTRALSVKSAREIASSATQFGREDDITVLTVAVSGLPADAA